MRILIACEESQVVCKAFRDKGHEAFSCDVLETSGDHPEWHINDDVRFHIHRDWDMIIAHPSCQYLTNSGVRWLYNSDKMLIVDRWIKLMNAMIFFNLFKGSAPKVCIENPIPHKWAKKGFNFNLKDEVFRRFGLDNNAGIGDYTQIIQPWQFGHTTKKATCLWLKGLPALSPTNIIEKHKRTADIHEEPPGKDRTKNRSRAFTGIAHAMASQWGSI